MKAPIDVGCPDCCAEPGKPCTDRWPFPPLSAACRMHFSRLEAADLINNVAAGDSGQVSTPKQFDAAVLATGLI